jgi:aspartyl protease family protein
VLIFALLPGWASGSADGLAAAVRDIAAREGFLVSGLERLAGPAPPQEAGEIRQRLRLLLSGYNYVLVEGPPGRIQRLVILGRGNPAPGVAPEHTVRAQQVGSQRTVEATLTGPTGLRQTLALIVDTGASSVVLPSTMIGALGFRTEDLRRTAVQTANGRMEAQQGTLPVVEVGSAVVQDVAVTFVQDQRLAGHALLGMSFLDRFRVKFDDLDGYLTLSPR